MKPMMKLRLKNWLRFLWRKPKFEILAPEGHGGSTSLRWQGRQLRGVTECIVTIRPLSRVEVCMVLTPGAFVALFGGDVAMSFEKGEPV